MGVLDQFNLVYGTDARILDPSIEVNAVTGIGPQVHLEPFHTVDWLVGGIDASSSVVADDKNIVFRGHKTEKMIPHLPLPPWPAGAPLLKTIAVDSKCHIYFHNPDVVVEGRSVGIAMVLLAPPLHCASLPVPTSLKGLIPGLKSVKNALSGLHKINKGMAKLKMLQHRLQKAMGVAEMAQITAIAAMGARAWFSRISGEEPTTPDAKGVYWACAETMQAHADYQEARKKLRSSPQPLEPAYFTEKSRVGLLEKEIEGHDLHTRALMAEQRRTMQRADEAFERLRRIEAEKERSRDEERILVEQTHRTAGRIAWLRAQMQAQTVPNGASDVEALRREHRESQLRRRGMESSKERQEQSWRHAVQHKEACLAKVRQLQSTLQDESLARSKKEAQVKAIRTRQGRRLDQAMPTLEMMDPLGVMMPSLTSFVPSFFQHSVKVGMSPQSYARVSLKVAAIVASDIVDYALGMVGDALLAGGPDAPVASWVAELAGSAMQNMVGSPLRSWGLEDRLDFSIPLASGTLLGGGGAQAKVEFHWRFTQQEGEGTWVRETGLRVGADLPGSEMDRVKIVTASATPGLEFELPEIW